MEGAARIDPAVEIRQSELLLHETSNGKIGSASTCSSSRPAVCALVGLDTLGQVSGYGARRSSGGRRSVRPSRSRPPPRMDQASVRAYQGSDRIRSVLNLRPRLGRRDALSSRFGRTLRIRSAVQRCGLAEYAIMAFGFVYALITSRAVWMMGADRVRAFPLSMAASSSFGVFNRRLGRSVRVNVLSGVISTVFMFYGQHFAGSSFRSCPTSRRRSH